MGGSILTDIPATFTCAEKIASLVKQRGFPKRKLCIVISAYRGETENLRQKALQVSKSPNKRELDMLLSTGERQAAALFSMALLDQGVRCTSITGSQAGILTSSEHGEASIVQIQACRLGPYLEKNDVIVLAGFQGLDAQGKQVTTLGKGGSDVSAVALAIALDCPCELIKDVGAYYSYLKLKTSVQPSEQPFVKPIATVDFKDALFHASFGHPLIQYKALQMARTHECEIWIRSLEETQKMTVIKDLDLTKEKREPIVHIQEKMFYTEMAANATPDEWAWMDYHPDRDCLRVLSKTALTPASEEVSIITLTGDLGNKNILGPLCKFKAPMFLQQNSTQLVAAFKTLSETDIEKFARLALYTDHSGLN